MRVEEWTCDRRGAKVEIGVGEQPSEWGRVDITRLARRSQGLDVATFSQRRHGCELAGVGPWLRTFVEGRWRVIGT
jgi:hypothetical protein